MTYERARRLLATVGTESWGAVAFLGVSFTSFGVSLFSEHGVTWGGKLNDTTRANICRWRFAYREILSTVSYDRK